MDAVWREHPDLTLPCRAIQANELTPMLPYSIVGPSSRPTQWHASWLSPNTSLYQRFLCEFGFLAADLQVVCQPLQAPNGRAYLPA